MKPRAGLFFICGVASCLAPANNPTPKLTQTTSWGCLENHETERRLDEKKRGLMQEREDRQEQEDRQEKVIGVH